VAVLRVIRGGEPGKLHELQGERTVLGRHPNCHVVFDNGAISRHHAQILESHGSYYIEDLRSRNGTYLNGDALEGRTELHDGDQVRLCDVVVAVELSRSSSKLVESGSAAVADTTFGERSTSEQEIIEESGLYSEESGLYGGDGRRQRVALEESSIVNKIDARGADDDQSSVRPELKLRAVLEITRALGRDLQVDSVLPKMLATLFHIFPQASQGFVLLKDPETNRLRVKATLLRKGGEADAVAVSMTVVRQAMATSQAILSENLLDDSRFKSSASLTKMKICSMMCAPLVDHEDAAMGVIQVVTNRKQEAFDKNDLDLLMSVASQAALAIENATLHEAAVHQHELERDLEFATQVQLGFLPKARPRIEDYEFADYYEAALRIGGDYFDYIPLQQGQLAVTIGDVAGKGVPAALLMARLYSSARYQLLTAESPAAAVAGLNREIASSGLGHRFITFLVMVLDPRDHSVVIVNAGHLAPLLRKNDGSVAQIGRESSGLPLGIVPDLDYEQTRMTLEAGNMLFAYTDGVTEAMNPERQIFGRQRLEECLTDSSTIQDVVKLVINRVEEFVDENSLRDDTCMVGLQRVPS